MGVSRKEAERRIRDAVLRNEPDVLDRVMERASRERDGVIPMVASRRRRGIGISNIVAAAAVLLLVLNIAGTTLRDRSERAVDAVIQLDINPSLQMDVNRAGRVLTVRALNADAQAVIGTMDLSGATTQVAVNAVIGALYQAGYLSQESNAILVSVGGRDTARSSEVQAEVVSDIGVSLNSYAVEAAILSQSIANPVKQEEESMTAQAQDYGISAGKALLIEKLLAVYPYYTEEELAYFTISELNQLLDAETELEDVQIALASDVAAEAMLVAAGTAQLTADATEETASIAERDAADEREEAYLAEQADAAEVLARSEAAPTEESAEAVGEESAAIEESAADTVLKNNDLEENDAEYGEPEESVSGNSAPESSVSGNSVSENSVSGNSVSDNTVSGNSVSGNSVSGNSVPGGGESAEGLFFDEPSVFSL